MAKYKEIFLQTIEIDELDLNFPYWNEEMTKENEVVHMNNPVLSESPAIHIDDLKNIIKTSESLGATHIYISDHCDHHGYEFDAVKYENLENE